MKTEYSIYLKTIIMTSALMIFGVIAVQLIPSLAATAETAFVDRKIAILVWLGVAYAAFAFWSYYVQKEYVQDYSKTASYKDITLEFSNISPILRTEDQVLKVLQELSGGRVKEVSLIYDLSRFFKLNTELQKLVEKDTSGSDATAVGEKKTEVNDFVGSFKAAPERLFTGKGFITFQNYKYAQLFKRMYDEAYRESLLKLFDLGETSKPLERFRKAASATAERKDNLEPINRSVSEFINLSGEGTLLNLSKTTSEPPKEVDKPSSLSRVAWKLLSKSSLKDRERESLARMKALLGPQFKIRRTVDPALLNFNFTPKTISSVTSRIAGSLVLFLVLPCLAYLFNFLTCKYDMLASEDTEHDLSYKLFSLVAHFLSLLVDQGGFFLIEVFFYRTRFIKASQMFYYLLTYYSFFHLLIAIVVPNFAIKQAFINYKPFASRFDHNLVVSKYMAAVNSIYFKLAFSVLNFKLVKPILIGRLIMHKHKRIQTSSNIIFGMSFVIASVFYVSFFSSIAPRVFLFFAPTLALLYCHDLFEYRRKKQAKLASTGPQKRRLADFGTGLPVLKRYDLTKLPVTIFSTALNILVIGTFLVCCLGYYGIAVDLSYSAAKQNRGLVDRFRGFVTSKLSEGSVLDKAHSLIGEVLSLRWWSAGTEPVIDQHLFDSVTKPFKGLLGDFWMLVVLFFYLIFTGLFLVVNNEEAVIGRVQKYIWKRQKRIENINFAGKSYREVNPAYPLLNGQQDVK